MTTFPTDLRGLAAADPAAAPATSTPLLIRQLERLPANPTAAMRVLWLADDPNSSSEDLAAAVGTDPALTARIMHMANSAYYGLSGRVPSSAFAITVLGFSAVRTLAAAAAAGALDQQGAVPKGFWSHAAGTAVASSLVAPRVGARRTEAFSLGLLHDLGRALLFRVDPVRYGAVTATEHGGEGQNGHDRNAGYGDPTDGDGSLCLAERAAFGIDHVEAATRVLAAWRFPPEFVDAIACHHQPVSGFPAPLLRALLAGEALALVAAASERSHDDAVEAAPSALPEALALAGIGADEVTQLAAQVRRDSDPLAASLH